VRKKGWFYALLLAVRAKLERIKPYKGKGKGKKGKNRRNSLLEGETSGFLR